MQVRNKATVDAPWVCYIHAHYHLIAIGVSVHQWNYRCSGLLYLSAWASTLLASTCKAILGPPNREASDSAGLHAFFMSLPEYD